MEQILSPGQEILEYVKAVSGKYGVRDQVEFERVVRGMLWDEGTKEWIVSVGKVGDGGDPAQDPAVEDRRFDVVVNCTGCLNNWKLPDI